MIKLKYSLLGLVILEAFSCKQEEINNFHIKNIEQSGNLISIFFDDGHNDLTYVDCYLEDLKLFISPKLYRQFFQRFNNFNDADKIHIIRYLHFSEHCYFNEFYQDFIYKFSSEKEEVINQVMFHIRKVSNHPLCFDEEAIYNPYQVKHLLKKTRIDIHAIGVLLSLD